MAKFHPGQLENHGNNIVSVVSWVHGGFHSRGALADATRLPPALADVVSSAGADDNKAAATGGQVVAFVSGHGSLS